MAGARQGPLNGVGLAVGTAPPSLNVAMEVVTDNG